MTTLIQRDQTGFNWTSVLVPSSRWSQDELRPYILAILIFAVVRGSGLARGCGGGIL